MPTELDEKIDALISEKLDAKLAPILTKLDALTPPPADDDEEETEKLDAFQLAKQTLRQKLDGFVKKEDLDNMSMVQLSQTLSKLQAAFENPSPHGTLNPLAGRSKTDTGPTDLFNTDPEAITWEETQ